jgi:hypothetical protein
VLQLMSGERTLLAVKEATLAFSPPGQGTAPLERKARLGRTAIGVSMIWNYHQPAAWHMRIDAVTAFRTITLEDDFDVPAQ